MVEDDWKLSLLEVLWDGELRRMHLVVGHLETTLIVVCFGPTEDHEASRWFGKILNGASSANLAGSSIFAFQLGGLEMKHFKSSHS
jgi:hypothetical protein